MKEHFSCWSMMITLPVFVGVCEVGCASSKDADVGGEAAAGGSGAWDVGGGNGALGGGAISEEAVGGRGGSVVGGGSAGGGAGQGGVPTARGGSFGDDASWPESGGLSAGSGGRLRTAGGAGKSGSGNAGGASGLSGSTPQDGSGGRRPSAGAGGGLGGRSDPAAGGARLGAGGVKAAGGAVAGDAAPSADAGGNDPTGPCPPGITKTLSVAKDGSGDFSTVQAAIDSIKTGNTAPIRVDIKPGTYTEKLTIADRSHLCLVGADATSTILTYHDANATVGSTSGSASVLVSANDFSAANLTFQNTYGAGSQAVALRATGQRQQFRHCRFVAYQDTLYTHNGTQYFRVPPRGSVNPSPSGEWSLLKCSSLSS